MAINTIKYIENYLKIRPKISNGEVVPLKFNEPQMRLYEAIKELSIEKKPVRIIILKARQMGFSTATAGIIFKKTATERLMQSAIITHRDATTQELYKMYRRFLDYLPNELRPSVLSSNAKELVFNNREGKGLDSTLKCMTATDEGVGRGGTTQLVHMSEFAFWNNAMEVYSSVMQCVPNTSNSMVIIESTANGYNHFKDLWDQACAGENDFVPLFFAWYELKDYRMKYDGFDLDQEEQELKRKYGVDNEQLAWRRWCIKNNCGNDIDKFHQEYPSNPEEAFLFSGNSYFKMDSIKEAKDRSTKPMKVGKFIFDTDANYRPINIRWENDSTSNGIIRMYREPNAKAPYVIGGDTAGAGSDAFIGQVINNLTAEQEAVLEYKGVDELFYSQQVYCLGLMYNNALLSIETNFSTYPQRKLEEWKYPKFYQREREDEFTHRMKSSYGYQTNVKSRPRMLANLQSIVKDSCYLIRDYRTLCELETFVKDETGKPEAMKGKHDDHVMALAIAYDSRYQQDFEPIDENSEDIKEQLPFEFRSEEDEGDVDSDYIWN